MREVTPMTPPCDGDPVSTYPHHLQPSARAFTSCIQWLQAQSLNDAVLTSVRAGDKVVIPVLVGEEHSARQQLSQLEALGVEVELRHEAQHRPRGTAAAAAAEAGVGDGAADEASTVAGGSLLQPTVSDDDADPVRVFNLFMSMSKPAAAETNAPQSSPASAPVATGADVESTRGGSAGCGAEAGSDTGTGSLSPNQDPSVARHKLVWDEGLRTLSSLMDDTSVWSGAAASTASSTSGTQKFSIGKTRHLRFEEVTLANFGPYGGEQVRYPLGKRGLVLITGKSNDGTGADSNGSGKVQY